MSNPAKHPSTIPPPRRPDRALDTFRAQLFLAALVGALVAAGEHAKVNDPHFYATTAAVGTLTFLVVHFIRTGILQSPPEEEVHQPDSAKLSESITSAIRSSYAISSKWISLWRQSSFRHYLHLDATASLIAYSFLYDSALLRLSKDEEDLKAFFNEGIDLV